MTAEQSRRLTALQNYPTRYELVITDGLFTYRIAYTARHTGRGLRDAVRAHAEQIVRTLSLIHI